MSGVETDYLVIGAGAIGMAFVDSLLDHGPADTRITIIDRHPKPGGHWNTSYPFVTLHQPSVTYGLSQLPLNDGVIDQAGPNAGFGELASGAQVQAYYDHAMRHKFVPSGRVHYLPMTDYEGGADGVHRIRTILSGDVREIGARKLVDGRKFAAQVPTITKRKWQADGVLVMTPGELGTLASSGMAVPGHFVIMGGGKTACDVGVWLLQMGVSARQISWVRPRDTWFFNRASIQTGADHLAQAIDFPRSQMRAAAAAASGAEIFHMMEADGHMLRIDRDSEPTKFHFPTISQAEVDLLATIEDVIRIGRVTSVIPGTLTGLDGTASVPEDSLYIDCTATAAPRSVTEPIWQGEDTIVPQLMQVPLVSLSAAAAGFIEGLFETDSEKNALGAPGRITDTVEHFPEALLINATNRMLWNGSTTVTGWLSDNRLDPGARMVKALASATPEMQAAAKSIRSATVAAVPNLQKLVLAEQARDKALEQVES
ncbi:MAG: NAD(P)-binding protein [Parerythrobacter sp.]